MSRLIAMIDGSIYTRSVSDHAAWASQRLSSTVELVHVLDRQPGPRAPADLSGSFSAGMRETLLQELVDLDALNAKAAQKKGRVILEEAQAVLTEQGVAEVIPKLRHGDLLEALEDLEAGADLMVIGKRGEAADFAKMHLGSNLDRVVRASNIPVLIASRAFRPIEQFVIAFDGQTTSMKAVDYVARTGLFAGLRCHLLTAGTRSSSMERTLENAEILLRAGGLSVESRIVAGQPDQVIARYVEETGIDLLVMGAYGHSRLRNLFIGSTTTEMIRNCLIPVLIYR